MMVLQHFGLNQIPFRPATEDAWYFANPRHDEALARLFYVVEEGYSFGLLTGPEGAGKTLLLSAVANEARRSGRRVALIDGTSIDAGEMLWQLAAALQLGPSTQESSMSLWRRVDDALAGLQQSQVQALVIVDHLDTAEHESLLLLERLLQTTTRPGWSRWVSPRITILGAASHARSAGPLATLADFAIPVQPWNIGDVEGFAGEAIRRAGGDRELFDCDAIAALTEISEGLPKTVNRLAHLALLAAADENREIISAEIVKTVAAELLPQNHLRAG